MDQSRSFDTLAETLVPDESRAMILLEVGAHDDGGILLESLRSLAGNRATIKTMNEKPPLVFLIYLPVERLREAVLHITERGVTRLKAIQPVVRTTSPSKNRG